MPKSVHTGEVVLELSEIYKSYSLAKEATAILDGVSLKLHRGMIAALVAPSGAGKSTLMHIAGLLSQPDKGVVRLLGQDCGKQSDRTLARLRSRHMGFVYQQHMLMNEMTCLENAMLPQMLIGKTRRERISNATTLLSELGLAKRLHHRPAELSGGERQRCAIARALINNPDCILADEPTGNLDPATADTCWDIFMRTLRDKNAAALIVTHNPNLAIRADCIYELTQSQIRLRTT